MVCDRARWIMAKGSCRHDDRGHVPLLQWRQAGSPIHRAVRRLQLAGSEDGASEGLTMWFRSTDKPKWYEFRFILSRRIVQLARWIYPKNPDVDAFYMTLFHDQMIYGRAVIRVEPTEGIADEECVVSSSDVPIYESPVSELLARRRPFARPGDSQGLGEADPGGEGPLGTRVARGRPGVMGT